MDSVVVTLLFKDQKIDVQLPTNVPLFMLAPILVETLDWAGLELQNEDSMLSARSQTSGIMIRPAETIGQANIVDGDILELILTKAHEEEKMPEDRVGGSGVYLQCIQTGQTFRIRGRTALIGRSSEVSINLSSLPDKDIVSRRHANLIQRGNAYWIKDENSTNGTLVDGYMLRSGETVRIRDGSLIQFGEDGPRMVFRQTIVG